jgi:hypothetical protein
VRREALEYFRKRLLHRRLRNTEPFLERKVRRQVLQNAGAEVQWRTPKHGRYLRFHPVSPDLVVRVQVAGYIG